MWQPAFGSQARLELVSRHLCWHATICRMDALPGSHGACDQSYHKRSNLRNWLATVRNASGSSSWPTLLGIRVRRKKSIDCPPQLSNFLLQFAVCHWGGRHLVGVEWRWMDYPCLYSGSLPVGYVEGFNLQGGRQCISKGFRSRLVDTPPYLAFVESIYKAVPCQGFLLSSQGPLGKLGG